MNDEMKLGVDYENVQSIMKKVDKMNTRQSIWYRIKYLEKHGVKIVTHYDSKRSPYWLRDDADKIMKIVFPKTRKRAEK